MDDIITEAGNVDTGLLKKFLEELPEKALNIGIRIVLAVVVLVVGVQVIKLIRKIVKKSLKRANADLGVIQFLDSLIKAILYIVLIFIILGNFGVQAASVVAIIGSVGVAIGLALQGSLSNLAGGVLILLLKPFRVGDYIIEDGHKNEGTVTEISLFYTKLTTVDNKIIVLPNGGLANTSLTNVTSSKKRRIDLTFGVAYSCDLKQAKELIERVIKSQEKTILRDPVEIYVDKLDASEVTIGARWWVNTRDYWSQKWKVTEEVKLLFDEKGIEIPFNQLDVHISNPEKES